MKRAYCDFALLSACFSLHQPSSLEHSAAGTTLKENTGLYTQGGAIKTTTASPAILQGHRGLDSHTAEE